MAEVAGIIRPVLPHFHPQLEVQALAEEAVELEPGRAPHPLQPLALGADDDGLLPRPIHPDDRGDVEPALGLLGFLHFDGDAVRHFLIELQGELLADGLRDAELQPAIGALTFREQRRRFGQALDDGLAQGIEVVALRGGERHDVDELVAPSELGHPGQQAVLGVHAVHLVHHRDGGPSGTLHPLERMVVFRVPLQRLEHEEAQVCVLERRRRRAVHGFVERPPLAAVQPWGVDECDLRIRQVADPENPVPRRLRPRRHDAQLLADQRIEQRRLADVGPTDQCRETASHDVVLPGPAAPCNNACSARSAATCSARRRLDPSPSLRTPDVFSVQTTQNVWACGSPSTRSTA